MILGKSLHLSGLTSKNGCNIWALAGYEDKSVYVCVQAFGMTASLCYDCKELFWGAQHWGLLRAGTLSCFVNSTAQG